ncbi:MAG TPA: 4-hydroxy-tetrahydrodipicolinate synthase [Hyphomicrobiales bacterium]|nr:4-hydroxy-tetrahydrodipicolinate synthase [Hyphomicrobiales bacterium]
MQLSQSTLNGIWLPLITPFRDGELDRISLRRLIRHYAAQPVDGLVLAATTGECLTLDANEIESLVDVSSSEIENCDRSIPIYLGISGSDTRKCVKTLERSASWPINGYLITCPYYTRPSQRGLYQHFHELAENSAKPILIYNIPYRTGVNIENETMLRLAEHPNIIGVKDCVTDAIQSFDLLRRRPEHFAVLTGEDALFYNALVQGADGGILAAAHIETSAYAEIRNELLAGNQSVALARWRILCDAPRLLFAEPSPAPIKFWLWRTGLIESAEVRLPMTPVSDDLAQLLNRQIAAGGWSKSN